jgi:hypothetical protein
VSAQEQIQNGHIFMNSLRFAQAPLIAPCVRCERYVQSYKSFVPFPAAPAWGGIAVGNTTILGTMSRKSVGSCRHAFG